VTKVSYISPFIWEMGFEAILYHPQWSVISVFGVSEIYIYEALSKKA